MKRLSDKSDVANARFVGVSCIDSARVLSEVLEIQARLLFGDVHVTMLVY